MDKETLRMIGQGRKLATKLRERADGYRTAHAAISTSPKVPPIVDNLHTIAEVVDVIVDLVAEDDDEQ